MAVEVARELPVKDVEIETPLETTRGLRVRDEVAVVPVLRAGLGMVEGFLRLLPDARVGHLGIQRDEEDHAPSRLLRAIPARGSRTRAFTCLTRCSPPAAAPSMRSTASSESGARQLELVCLVAAPEGLAAVHAEHPDVRIWTAAVDRELDENAYIRPGLGDAGDRVFGTL